MDGKDLISMQAGGPDQFGGFVSADTAIDLLRGMIDALEANAKDLAPDHKGRIEWVVTKAHTGSLDFALAASAPAAESMFIAELAGKQVIRQTNALLAGAIPKTAGPPAAIRALVRLIEMTEENAISRLDLQCGGLRAEITANARIANVRIIVDRSIGSVEGRIMGVTFAGSKPQFTLEHSLDMHLVNCTFDEEFEAQVLQAIKQRVLVSGLVTTKTNGLVSNVSDVSRIYRFPADRELPTLRELVGSDPDFTDGLPADAWIRRERDQ